MIETPSFLEAPDIPYFREVLVFLLSSVLIVPLLHRLKTSPVLGYLAVGIVVGPHALGLVDMTDGIESMARLGIIFLLFMIGLEISFERLLAMKKYVFGLGFLQVLVTSAVIAGIALMWGNSPQMSVLLGACFSLSSTAVITKILLDHKKLDTHLGRVGFSVLLGQDIMVVPILILVNIFGSRATESIPLALGMAAVKSVIAITVILFLGRLLIKPLFRMVSQSSGSPELFAALALLVILLTSALTQMAGLSTEMGAFMAGLLLAETEHRHRIIADIKPFDSLLLGLFFIMIGMQIDIPAVMERLGWVAASVVGLFGIKAVIVYALARLFKIDHSTSAASGLLLGQGGEFAFVAIGAAMTLELLPEAVGHFMLLVTAVSMVVTPLTVALALRVYKNRSDGR